MIFSMLIEHVNLVPKSEFEEYIGEAKELIGSIDMDDVPFVALALAMPNDGIWSEDRDYGRQSKIRIWGTNELIRLLKE